MADFFEETDLDRALALQNGLMAFATGGKFDGENQYYQELRALFAGRADTKEKLPDFMRRCRDLSQFWIFIKNKYPTYQERRNYLLEEFQTLLEYLETQERTPGVIPISATLESFDPEHVHAIWQKALDRRIDDPEGAITAARTLVETVCKHILDDIGIGYPDDADLPKLWSITAEQLNLAPQQHQEGLFKQILGNCQSVVNNLGAIRNRVGDAHGHGRNPVKPKPRHAELAVNLAGTMASFLVETWREIQKKNKNGTI